MKKSVAIALSIASLVLSACEMPDVAGMNSMPKQTGEMSNKMDTTNAAIHKQTLLLALVEMNKPENQEDLVPVPTGLMPAGKVFAEEATPSELVELTYNEMLKLEGESAAAGITNDNSTVSLSEAEKNVVRRKRLASLYSLMVIAAFTQDEKIEEIIRHDIKGEGRFKDTALAFLALRGYFIREVLLKLSLKINDDAANIATLDNSGKMKEAIKYLEKLDRVSRAAAELPIKVDIDLKVGAEAPFLPLHEDFRMTRTEAGKMWALALAKAQAGTQIYQADATTARSPSEIEAQNKAISIMQSRLDSWK